MPEEQVDILDEFANKTGHVLPKSEVHDKELRHGGTHVWIYNSKGELLLQLRDKTKKLFPDRWDVSVAGHISAGDTPLETGIREAEEELGLTLVESDFEFIGITNAIPYIPETQKLHKVFDWNYLVMRDLDVNTLTLQKGETAAAAWKHIDVLTEEVLAPNYLDIYSKSDRYIFLMAAAEIRKRVNDIGSVS